MGGASSSSNGGVFESLTVVFAALSGSSSGSNGSGSSVHPVCPVSVPQSFRPSLEQQAALLTAALTQLQQQWQQWRLQSPTTDSSSSNACCSCAQLCAVLLRWFTANAVMHPNPKKVRGCL